MKEIKCFWCNGTGEEGFDRCYPPNVYICYVCNGTGKITEARRELVNFCSSAVNHNYTSPIGLLQYLDSILNNPNLFPQESKTTIYPPKKEKLTFREYQTLSHKTAEYPKTKPKYIYPLLGLVGETGEFVEKVKKLIRNKNIACSYWSSKDLQKLQKELGDILWYIAELATLFNFNLENIAKENLAKLQDRQKRNVIKSEGDER